MTVPPVDLLPADGRVETADRPDADRPDAEGATGPVADALAQMPVLRRIGERFRTDRPLEEAHVAIVFHMTKEAAALALTVRASGAETTFIPSKVATAEREVIPELRRAGIQVLVPDDEDQRRELLRGVLALRPDLLIDNADLFEVWHDTNDPPPVAGATIHSISAAQIVERHVADGRPLRFPVMTVGSSRLKLELESSYGTGQSVLNALVSAANLQLGGKRIVVVGYGNVGSGFARFARGLNARVVIVQNSPYRALKAHLDGYEVLPLDEAVATADVVVTATGSPDVLTAEQFRLLPDGAYIGNVGRVQEIDVAALTAMASSVTEVDHVVTDYVVGDRRIRLLGRGHQFNHMAGQANAPEMMDLSLALHAYGLDDLWKRRGSSPPEVTTVPDRIADAVAAVKLEDLGVRHR